MDNNTEKDLWLKLTKDYHKQWLNGDATNLFEKHKEDFFLFWVACFYQDQSLWDSCISYGLNIHSMPPNFLNTNLSILNILVKFGFFQFNNFDDMDVEKLDVITDFLLKQKINWQVKINQESHFCLLCNQLNTNPGWDSSVFPKAIFNKIASQIIHPKIHLFYSVGTYICSLTSQTLKTFEDLNLLNKKNLKEKDFFKRTGEGILIERNSFVRNTILSLVNKQQWPFTQIGLLASFNSNNHTNSEDKDFFEKFATSWSLWPDKYVLQEEFIRKNYHLLKKNSKDENNIRSKYEALNVMFQYYPLYEKIWNGRVQKAQINHKMQKTKKETEKKIL